MSDSDNATDQGKGLIKTIIEKADADGEGRLQTLVRDFARYVVNNEKSFLFFHWLPKEKRIEIFRKSGQPSYLVDETCAYFQWLLGIGTNPTLTIEKLGEGVNNETKGAYKVAPPLPPSVENPHPQPWCSSPVSSGFIGDGSIIIYDHILSAKYDVIETLAHEFFHDFQGECVKYKQHKKSDHDAAYHNNFWYENMSDDNDVGRYKAYVDAIWPTWYDAENPMSDEDLKKTPEYVTLFNNKRNNAGSNTGSGTVVRGNQSGSLDYWAAHDALEELRSVNFEAYKNAPHERDARHFADEFLEVFRRKYREEEHVIRSKQKAGK